MGGDAINQKGWRIYQGLVAPADLDPSSEVNARFINSLNEAGSWGVMPTRNETGEPYDHLVDIISRPAEGGDEPDDGLTALMDAVRSGQDDPPLPKEDIIRQVKVKGRVLTLVRGGKDSGDAKD